MAIVLITHGTAKMQYLLAHIKIYAENYLNIRNTNTSSGAEEEENMATNKENKMLNERSEHVNTQK